MHLHFKSNPLMVAIVTTLALSACGKNMSISLKGKDANNATATTFNANKNKSIDLKKGSTPQSKIGTVAGDAPVETRVDPSQSSPSASPSEAVPQSEIVSAGVGVAVEVPNLNLPNPTNDATVVNAVETAVAAQDGELHPYSVFDLNDSSAKRISQNLGSQVLGIYTHVDRETGVGFVKSSNVLFRSILAIAPQESITEITTFELELAGLRLYDPNGTGLKKQSLKDQRICIAETEVCSDELSKIELPILFDYKDQGAVFEGGNLVTLDMRKLFGLEKLSTEELAAWIYKNSTEFSAPNYRKFRFVIADRVFLETGSLKLVYKTTQAPADNAQYDRIVNGDDDVKTPLINTSPVEMPVIKTESVSVEEVVLSEASQTSASPNTAAAQRPQLAPETLDSSVQTYDATAQVAEAVSTAPQAEAAPVEAVPAPVEQQQNTQQTSVVASSIPQIIADNNNDNEFVEPETKTKTATRKAAPMTKVIKSKKTGQIALKLELSDMYLTFDTDSAKIKSASNKKLEQTATVLHRYLDVIRMVNIIGFTDSRASCDYNCTLSKKRAAAVAKILGLPDHKVRSVGKGEISIAQSACKTADCREDRKVVLRIDLTKYATKSQIQLIRTQLIKIWKK